MHIFNIDPFLAICTVKSSDPKNRLDSTTYKHIIVDKPHTTIRTFRGVDGFVQVEGGLFPVRGCRVRPRTELHRDRQVKVGVEIAHQRRDPTRAQHSQTERRGELRVGHTGERCEETM